MIASAFPARTNSAAFQQPVAVFCVNELDACDIETDLFGRSADALDGTDGIRFNPGAAASATPRMENSSQGCAARPSRRAGLLWSDWSAMSCCCSDGW